MPAAAAGAVVGWLVGVGITGTVATFIGTAVYIGTALAINAGLNKLGEALAGKPKIEQGGPDSREFTIKGTVEPRQLIYGQVRSGGAIVFVGTSGTDNNLLNFVVAYAGHQCQEISDVWLDSRHIPAANILGTGEVNLAAFQDGGPRLYVLKYLGAPGQVVDPELDLRYTEWTSNHVGFGITYIHFRLDKSDKVWSGTAPSSFFALIKGRRLYDPRKDSTSGGSGSHRDDNPSTWEWSDNWALCVRDYITGGSVQYNSSAPDKRLTVGESDSRIEESYVITAANISDEDVIIPPASPVTTQKRYNCNVQLSCGVIHAENLETLLAAGAGKVSYIEGKYRIYAGAYNAPTVSLTADDVIGGIEVSTHPGGDENFNFVNGEFMDPARNWTMQTFPSQRNTTYETDDGGQEMRFIALHAVTNNYRSQRIAFWHLNQSRNKTTVKFKELTPKALLIGEWETFDITIPEYGWNAQVFRCFEIEDLSNGFVSITARIESAALHDDPEVADYIDPTTNIPPIYSLDTPPAVTGFVARPARDGILFKWNQSSRNGARFALYEHTSTTPFSSATKIWEGNANFVFIDKLDLTTRYYWVKQLLWGAESTETPVGAGLAGQTATLTQWIPRGEAIAGGTTARYTGGAGSASWASLYGCYSVDAYQRCHIAAKHNQVNPAHTFIALDDDPVAAAAGTVTDYGNLAYGFHVGNSGQIDVYESAVAFPHQAVSNIAPYTAETELAITYDGTNVRYLVDRVVKRTVNDPGRTFYGLIAFNRNTIGSGVHNMKFGPTENLDFVDTPDMNPNAATDTYIQTHAGPTVYAAGTSTNVLVINITAEATGHAVATLMANASTTLPVGVLSITGQITVTVATGTGSSNTKSFALDALGAKIALEVSQTTLQGSAIVVVVNIAPGVGAAVTFSDAILKLEDIKK